MSKKQTPWAITKDTPAVPVAANPAAAVQEAKQKKQEQKQQQNQQKTLTVTVKPTKSNTKITQGVASVGAAVDQARQRRNATYTSSKQTPHNESKRNPAIRNKTQEAQTTPNASRQNPFERAKQERERRQNETQSATGNPFANSTARKPSAPWAVSKGPQMPDLSTATHQSASGRVHGGGNMGGYSDKASDVIRKYGIDPESFGADEYNRWAAERMQERRNPVADAVVGLFANKAKHRNEREQNGNAVERAFIGANKAAENAALRLAHAAPVADSGGDRMRSYEVPWATNKELGEENAILAALARNNERRVGYNMFKPNAAGAGISAGVSGVALGLPESDAGEKAAYKRAGLPMDRFVPRSYQYEKAREEHPVASTIGDIAGSTASMVATGGIVGEALEGARWFGKLPEFAKHAVSSAITMGTTSGISTGARTGDAQETAKKTVAGALGGAVFGAADYNLNKLGDTLLFNKGWQNKILPEIIKSGIASGGGAAADTAVRAMFGEAADPSSIATAMAFGAITHGIETIKATKANRAYLDDLNNRMMADYAELVRMTGANRGVAGAEERLVNNILDYNKTMKAWLNGEKGVEIGGEYREFATRPRFVGQDKYVKAITENLDIVSENARNYTTYKRGISEGNTIFGEGAVSDIPVAYESRTPSQVVENARRLDPESGAARSAGLIERRMNEGARVTPAMIERQAAANAVQASQERANRQRLDAMLGTQSAYGAVRDAQGRQANAAISGQQKVINPDSPNPVSQSDKHENAHRTFDLSPETKTELVENLTGANFEAAVERRMNGLGISREEATEEALADIAQTLPYTSKAIDRIERLANNDRGFADMLYRGLRGLTAGDTSIPAGDTFTRKELAIAQRIMEEGIARASHNKSAEGNQAVRYSFAGEKAKTADTSLLQQAQSMEQSGATPEEIWRATGWGKGADGKWRFEIDDADMQLKKVEYAKMRHTEHGSTRLSDLISHKQLFEQYPHLASLVVSFDDLDGASGQYSRSTQRITLDDSLKNNEAELKEVLIHELQHAIQHYEGFASGSSPEYWQYRIDAKDVPLNEGFDKKVADARAELTQIMNTNPQLFMDVRDLMMSEPSVPRGDFDWVTLEPITPDPPEWQEFDRRRDELAEQYGEIEVFDAMELFGKEGMYRRMMNKKPAYDLYHNTAGEIEARDAAYRSRFDETKRWARFPRSLKPDADRVFADSGKSFSIAPIKGNNGDYGTGVYLDTNIFDGIKPRNWNRVLSDFVYKNLAGTDIEVFDNKGDSEIITFAKKNERVTKDGAKNNHRVIDKLARAKGNTNMLSIVHIDELLQTSINSGTTNEHLHGWLDQNGWELRKAFVQDKNGHIYETTLNISKAKDGRNILYALSNTKEIDEGDVPSARNAGGARTLTTDLYDNSISQPGSGVKKYSIDIPEAAEENLSPEAAESGYLAAERDIREQELADSIPRFVPSPAAEADRRAKESLGLDERSLAAAASPQARDDAERLADELPKFRTVERPDIEGYTETQRARLEAERIAREMPIVDPEENLSRDEQYLRDLMSKRGVSHPSELAEHTPTRKESRRSAFKNRSGAETVRAKLYTQLVDDMHPFFLYNRAGEKAAGKSNYGKGNAYKLAMNSKEAGARASYILLDKMVDYDNNFIGDGLSDTLQSGGITDKNIEDFNKYLVARHAAEWLDKGAHGGYKAVYTDNSLNYKHVALAMANDFETLHPEFKAAADALYKWYDKFMQTWLVDTGCITQDQLKAMRDKYPAYVPFLRETGKAKSSKQSRRDGDVIKKAIGTPEYKVHDPIENIMYNVGAYVNYATRNGVKQAAVRLYDEFESREIPEGEIFINPLAEYWREVEPADSELKDMHTVFRPKGGAENEGDIDKPDAAKGITDTLHDAMNVRNGNIVTVMFDGKPRYFEVQDQEFLHAIENLNPTKMDGLLGLISGFSRARAAMLTSYKPTFALVTNPIRDLGTYILNSEDKNKVRAFAAWINSYYDIAKTTFSKNMAPEDSVYEQYKAAGGEGSGLYESGSDKIRDSIKQFKLTPKSAAKKIISKIIGGYSGLADAIEAGPRKAEFKRTLNEGYDYHEALFRSKDVTTNFSRGGKLVKQLNAVSNFFNASVQGVDKYFRHAKNNPASFAIGSGVLAVIALAAWAWNHQAGKVLGESDEDVKDAKENLSNYTKNNFYYFYIGDGKYLTINKPRESAAIVSGIEAILDKTLDGEEDRFKGFFSDYLLNQFLPDGNIFAVSTYTDLMANKDFRGMDIVPSELQDLPRELQYDDNTSYISKWMAQPFGTQQQIGLVRSIGDFFDISPKKLDYIINNEFGVLGTINKSYFTPSTFPVKDNKITITPSQATMGLSDNFLKDSRFSQDKVSIFYDNKRAAELQSNGYPSADNQYLTSRYNQSANVMSIINALYKEDPNAFGAADIKRKYVNFAKANKDDPAGYSDELYGELKKLYDIDDTIVNLPAIPKQLSRTVKGEKEVYAFHSPAAAQNYREDVNKAVEAAYRELFNDVDFAALPREEKVGELKKAQTAAVGEVKNFYIDNKGAKRYEIDMPTWKKPSGSAVSEISSEMEQSSARSGAIGERVQSVMSAVADSVPDKAKDYSEKSLTIDSTDFGTKVKIGDTEYALKSTTRNRVVEAANQWYYDTITALENGEMDLTTVCGTTKKGKPHTAKGSDGKTYNLSGKLSAISDPLVRAKIYKDHIIPAAKNWAVEQYKDEITESDKQGDSGSQVVGRSSSGGSSGGTLTARAGGGRAASGGSGGGRFTPRGGAKGSGGASSGSVVNPLPSRQGRDTSSSGGGLSGEMVASSGRVNPFANVEAAAVGSTYPNPFAGAVTTAMRSPYPAAERTYPNPFAQAAVRRRSPYPNPFAQA